MSPRLLPTLDKLLSPFPVDAFTRQFDDRAPVLLRPVVSTPLDLPRLDAFVAASGLRWPTLLLEGPDGPIPPQAYTHGVQWGQGHEPHLVDLHAVHRGLSNGQRVVLPDLHRHHAETAELVRAFEQALHMRGHATAVLAPADGPARTRAPVAEHQHLLQCHGTRTCTVISPTGTSTDFEVVVGCSVYVPPGHTVVTVPSSGPSLAVDVSLRPVRVRDVAAAELGRLSRAELRTLAPVGLLAQEGAVAKKWAELVDGLLADADHAVVLEQLVDGFVQSRLPHLHGQLAAQGRAVGPGDVFRRRPGVMYRVVDGEDSVELRFHGKSIRFPAGAAELARFVAEAPGWRLADLPGVPETHRRGLAQRLVSEGFCTHVD